MSTRIGQQKLAEIKAQYDRGELSDMEYAGLKDKWLRRIEAGMDIQRTKGELVLKGVLIAMLLGAGLFLIWFGGLNWMTLIIAAANIIGAGVVAYLP